MKVYRLISWGLIGLFLQIGLVNCSTPPKGPESDQIRKRADEGTRDLQTEEQRRKQ